MSGFTEILQRLESRRTGRTTALAMWAKEVNGVVICDSRWEADRVKRTYDCKTASIKTPEMLRGIRQPAMLDTTAIIWMERFYVEELDRTKKSQESLRQENERLSNETSALFKKMKNQKSEITELKRKLDLAVEALGVYADGETISIGGKCARKALAQIRGEG